jgi:ABC-type sugar transport system ATPase subunit
MLEIGHLKTRLPRELSGGQRQRVAMGRAVVRRPKVFLFDEPLSNLDAALRQQMRLELLRLHRRLSATMVYVTHDQVEAMTLADRIAVLRQGQLVQVGAPSVLYNRPCNTFVARFFGTPEMNLLAGVLRGGEFRAADGELGLQLPAPGYRDGAASLGMRAEDLTLVPGDGGLRARVDVVEHLGSEDLLHLQAGASRLVVRCSVAQSPRSGSEVRVRFDPQRCHYFASDDGDGDGDGGTPGARLQPAGAGEPPERPG